MSAPVANACGWVRISPARSVACMLAAAVAGELWKVMYGQLWHTDGPQLGLLPSTTTASSGRQLACPLVTVMRIGSPVWGLGS
jgi:hypothetical protein